MAVLDPDVLSVIIYMNARGRPPSEVVKLIKEEFDVDVVPSTVCKYNPNLPTGRKLPAHLRKLFVRERDRFHREIEAIPISSKAFRLQAYQEMYEAAGKNLSARETALKGARQEMEGDKLTVQGTGRGGAILTEQRQAMGTSQVAAFLSGLLELPADSEADVVDAEMVDTDGNEGVSEAIEPA